MHESNQITTLVVMATCNNAEIIQDQIEAIRWSCTTPIKIVVVDDSHKLPTLPHCTILHSGGKIHKPAKVGFKVNEGIRWAAERFDFQQVMVLDDDALPIGRGLDAWALEILKNEPKVGLLGVKDDVKACALYNEPHKVAAMQSLLKKWADIGDWQPPKEVVFYAVNFQSRAAVDRWIKMGLLEIDKEIWPTPCETFQSWITTLAGFELKFWGRYPHELKPPLYSMHHGSVKPQDPRTISPEYLVHHSIRHVPGVNEWEIRNHYRTLRSLSPEEVASSAPN